MRRAIWIAIPIFLSLGCSSSSPAPVANRSAMPSASATVQPSPAATPVPIASSYGLLVVNSTLEMITPDGQVGATASVSPGSTHTCGGGLAAMVQPPVSASATRVYFRDGDTKIRYLRPSGETGDATTVPGDASTLSSFSASPDDGRIAVLVEDFSAAGKIGIRLYVEDLLGGGHHADIFATTTAADATGKTLWPIGWHQGRLVLAQTAACSNSPLSVTPSELHVADVSNGARVATITCAGVMSDWPSAAGVACLDQGNNSVSVFNWAGKLFATTQDNWGSNILPVWQTGISPSGQRIFFASQTAECDYPCATYHTEVNVSYTKGYLRFGMSVDGSRPACLWIDEDHLLGPDTTLALTLNGATPAAVAVSVTRLAAKGQCAGRFPGGL